MRITTSLSAALLLLCVAAPLALISADITHKTGYRSIIRCAAMCSWSLQPCYILS